MILKHIVREPKVKTENPSLVLMLHGYGSNEQDLFSFANKLPDELLVVSAQAPMSLGFGAYAWYTINIDVNGIKYSDIPEAIKAREMISQFIDELQEAYSFNPKKSFLMGFSQGTILSYAVALSYPKKIQNIVAMSGYINDDIVVLPSHVERLKNLNIFCSHGTEDTVIPIDLARNTSKKLKSLAVQHAYNEYYEAHGISLENFSDMLVWINYICAN